MSSNQQQPYGHDAPGPGYDDPPTQRLHAAAYIDAAYPSPQNDAAAAYVDAAYVPPQPGRHAAPEAPAEVAAAAPPEPDRPPTAAEKARAEGRPQILAPGLQPAALTAVLSLLLAGAGATGRHWVVVAPLVLLQAVTAAGWFRLNGMWPARQGIALAFAGGLAADIALLAAGDEHALAAIIGTIGVWVLLVLVLQLRNRSSADERMYALTAGVTASALTVLAASYLPADPDAVVVGGCAVALAALARAVRLPQLLSIPVALLAATGAGIGAGSALGLGQGSALIGLAAGGCALIGLRVASYDYPSKFVHMTAGVALPLMAAAPVVYLLGRAAL